MPVDPVEMLRAKSDAIRDAAALHRRLEREVDNLRTKLRVAEGHAAQALRMLKLAEEGK